jgi:hypothetical protein
MKQIRIIQLLALVIMGLGVWISHPALSPILFISAILSYAIWWDWKYNKSSIFKIGKKDDTSDNV